ncbi:tRNA1(Val) (adenine(37)-N6)-methyltransferase [Albidovulum sediminicola]|uniref:Methyltransferase domain-containing protein n=1 Tax=Albidovulum sediminicola TaxID=2984331 RepID=A0ABT2YZG3_9RHOB|nr:methyltransferase domain-containing protein [Defluviimonas sp. WL0075]MCV2863896.1 methyltransferase domain-containing protein [Defluviimonas sp. WL0075]
MFADTDLSCDGFLGGRLRIWQPREGYRAAMDPVLLAAACPARPGETVLELGCGAGVASLCLAARVPGVRVTGLELQAGYADLARRNAAESGLGLTVVDGDLAHIPAGLRAQSFDHVIANPPYYPASGGTPARDAGRERALREKTPLALWLQAALRRLHPGGWLTMIQSADRLADVLALKGAGSIAILPVAPRAGRDATRVILRARKGGRGALRLLAPFVLHEGERHMRDGDSFTAAAQAVLRHGAALEI